METQREEGYYQPKCHLHFLSAGLWTWTSSVCQRFRGRMKCSACASAQHKTWQDSGCSTLNHNFVPKVLRLACQTTWRDRCSCWLCDLHINATPGNLRFLLTPTSMVGKELSAMELVKETIFQEENCTEYLLRTFPKDPGLS